MASSSSAAAGAEATGIETTTRPSRRRSDSLSDLAFLGDDDPLEPPTEEAENAPLMEEDDLEAYELDDWHHLHDDNDQNPPKATNEDEDSPYAEVRAAVRNYDEDLPCGTIRAWAIGLLLVLVGASTNTLFSLRQPSISVGDLVAQILAWPLGHGWARFMPDWQLEMLGRRWKLNPGPFNVKEASVIAVMASVSFSVAYSTDIILAQLVFYKQDFGLLFQMLLTISTQSLGYGIAGAMRKFLVIPAGMVWPATLVNVAMINVIYSYENKDRPDRSFIGGSMPRYRWFGIVTAASFIYFFIPGFLAQFLSAFVFLTWMAPQNAVVNQLFGGTTGLSLLPITFDWTQIAGWVGSPLIPPWSAIANVIIGVVVFYVAGSSLLHYSGAWYAEFLPISDANTYDNTGKPYNTSRVLTPEFTLDEEAYRAYSPLFISTSFAMAYGLSFAAISSLIVHTFLHYRKQIWKQYRNSSGEKPDIHMRLMSRYVEVPASWYLSLFVAMLALGLYTVLAYPTKLSWWAYLLAVSISCGFALPIGIIEAICSNQIGLNVLTEFVYGYIQPGRPLALMIFKTFGYITMSQALRFVADLKFGHYMKIPPRTMFSAQVAATTLSCIVQIVTLNLALVSIEDVCDSQQRDRFTCPGGRVFFSASVIWGLIGPDRMFSPGRIYSGLFLFFILGAITPVIIHQITKRHPRSPARFLMAPLIFGGAGAIPPATPLNYFSWAAVGFVFQYWIKKRHFGWWSRLNFLTSCGLDLGLALATLFVFFAFSMHGIRPPRWWGNTVVSTTMDVQGTAVRARVAEGEHFGPDVW
ncbi:hypothetical protein CP532_6306 [Ophiocordyceps camponoti-leonardi (nom. inval.)]|nr:hypothetical protein CP532_6306 [Ophiocordyceps camponoti-leonardi (nom. inval.)]